MTNHTVKNKPIYNVKNYRNEHKNIVTFYKSAKKIFTLHLQDIYRNK